MLVLDFNNVRRKQPEQYRVTKMKESVARVLNSYWWNDFKGFFFLALFFDFTLEVGRKVVHECWVEDVLFDCNFDFQNLAICKLVQVSYVLVSDHLVLIMAKTKEKYRFAVLDSSVNYLDLASNTWEFNWNSPVQKRILLFHQSFASLDYPSTNVVCSCFYVDFQMPASALTVECFGKNWYSFTIWHCH